MDVDSLDGTVFHAHVPLLHAHVVTSDELVAVALVEAVMGVGFS